MPLQDALYSQRQQQPITKRLANVGPNATPFQQRQPGEMGIFAGGSKGGLPRNDQLLNPPRQMPNSPPPQAPPYRGQPSGSFTGQSGMVAGHGEYRDSYQQLLDSLNQGDDGQNALQRLLGNFQGSQEDLRGFMETPAFRQIMAYSTKGSDAYKQFASLEDPTLQSMNVGLGQISQAGARGIQDAMGALNASGMGRNAGAVAAAKSGIGMDVAGKQASYQAAMQQAAYQNQVAKLGTLMDLEQQMAQLALGYNPQPRQPSGKASTGDWLALAGSVAGAAANFYTGNFAGAAQQAGQAANTYEAIGTSPPPRY